MSEPSIRTVRVPAITIDEAVLQRIAEKRAELGELITPEALARLDAAEAEFSRRVIEGEVDRHDAR